MPALVYRRLALVQRRVLRPCLKVVGHADLSTGSRRPVETVFWAIISTPTVSIVPIISPVVAPSVVIVVSTRSPIVAAVAGAAAIVLAATRFLAAASCLARPIGAGSLLLACAVDEVASGLLGGSSRFVCELPGPFFQCLLRKCVRRTRVAFMLGHLRAIAREMALRTASEAVPILADS